MDRRDDLSLRFAGWRLNLRASKTEPLLRLNVGFRGDVGALAAHVARPTAAYPSLKGVQPSDTPEV